MAGGAWLGIALASLRFATSCTLDDLSCRVCADQPVFVARLISIGSTQLTTETDEPVELRRLTFRVLRMASGSTGDWVHDGQLTVDVIEGGWQPPHHTLRVGWRYAVAITDYFEGTLPASVSLLTDTVKQELEPVCGG